MKRSWVSAPVLVKPQATRPLCPSTTSGIPGKVAPTTSRPGQERWAKYQTDGTVRPRCGVVREERLSGRALRSRDRPGIRAGKAARGQEREPPAAAVNERAEGCCETPGRRRPAIPMRRWGRRACRVGRGAPRPPARPGTTDRGSSTASRPVPSVGRVEVEDPLRGRGNSDIRSRMRSRDHSRARSRAITLAQTTVSASVHGSGSNPTMRNSGGSGPVPRLEPRVDPVDVGGDSGAATRVRGRRATPSPAGGDRAPGAADRSRRRPPPAPRRAARLRIRRFISICHSRSCWTWT